MIYGFFIAAILGYYWEPSFTITVHHRLHRVHSKVVADVSFLMLAADAVTALSVENRDHMISFLYVFHIFTNALDNSARQYFKGYEFSIGKRSRTTSDMVTSDVYMTYPAASWPRIRGNARWASFFNNKCKKLLDNVWVRKWVILSHNSAYVVKLVI